MIQEVDLSSLVTKDGLASPLRLNVCVLCGSLGSSIDVSMLVTAFDSSFDTVGQDETVVCETNLVTGEVESKVMAPTDKKTVTKILRKEYPLGVDVMRVRFNPHSKKSKEKKKKGEDSFYNCATLETIVDGSNISCKVFPNGNIQVAGCKTIGVANKVPIVVRNFISKYCPTAIRDTDGYVLRDLRVVMLKTSFKFNRVFDLEELKNGLLGSQCDETGRWKSVIYEPGTFPGLNIKRVANGSKDQTTIIIFRQGNAAITGAKTVAQLCNAYLAITEFVRRNQGSCCEDSDDSDSDDSDSDDSEPPAIMNLRKMLEHYHLTHN